MSRDVTVRFLGDTSHLEHGIGRMQVSLGGLSSFAGIATAGVAGLAAFGAAVGAVGLKAVQASAGMEQARIAFTTLLGSAQEADKFIREMQAFAARTPFTFQGLQENAKRLLAMGFEGNRVIPILTAVGNAAAGIGGGQDAVDRITRALGQMQAKGKVSAEEMTQQLGELIPAWDFLAKKIGVDVPTAQKMAEEGAIDVSVAITAILEGMQGRFGGLMDKQSTTILGMWSNVQDALQQILTVIGDKITSTFDLKAKLGAVMGFLGDVQAMLQKGWGPLEVLDLLLLNIGLKTSAVSAVNDVFRAMIPIFDSLRGAVLEVVAAVQAHWSQIEELVRLYFDQLRPALATIVAHKEQLKLVVYALGIVTAALIVVIALAVYEFAQAAAGLVSLTAAIGDLLGWIGRLTGGLDGIARAAKNAADKVNELRRAASDVPLLGGVLSAVFGGGPHSRQHGGSVLPGHSYLVGEAGPEILTMGSRGGYVSPGGGGDVHYHVNVTAPVGSHPGEIGREVVGYIQEYERRSGRAWRTP